MGYKHTKFASVDVPYSFRCEQCMKESGRLLATISGEAEINSNFKNLNDKKQQKLDEMANENLVKKVKNTYRNITEKQIYSEAFKDKCPHCHKPQSWAVSRVKNEIFITPLIWVIVSIIVGVGFCFYDGVENIENNLTIAIIAAGICLAIAAGSLLINLVKVGHKKKLTSTATQKNVPVIEWNTVQGILNQ